MLESYAVGTTFTMSTAGVTTAVDKMIADMDRLSRSTKQAQTRLNAMVTTFKEMASAATGIGALVRALERAGAAVGRSGRGSRAGDPLDQLKAQGRYDNRLFDAQLAAERRRAQYEDRIFEQRQQTVRRQAEYENRIFNERQKAAERAEAASARAADRAARAQERTAARQFRDDFALAGLENQDLDRRRRAQERAQAAAARAADQAARAQDRAAGRQFRDDFALANRENQDRDRRRRAGERAASSRSHDWVMVGQGAQMAGGTLSHGAETAFERGMEVAHLRTQILADSRVTPKQADEMVKRAYDATASAPGTKVAGNLHALIDLKNVTGSLEEAEAMLPRFARLTALLAVMDKRRGGDGAFAAAKAMEIMGGMIEDKTGPNGETVHELNPELLQKRLDYMARVSVATNARVTPQDYLGFAKQARTAGMLLSDEFIYEKLPAYMMAVGGQRAGTALMSASQIFDGQKLTPKSMEGFIKYGLASDDAITTERNRAGKKVQKVHTDRIMNADLLRHDPAAWVLAVSKRLDQKGVRGSEAQIRVINEITQRGTVAGLFADLLKDSPAILKEQENIRATRPDVAEHFAQNDPVAKMQQLQAAFDKLMTTLGTAGMADAVSVIDRITGGLNALSAWAEAHPTMARILVDTAAGLGVLATALGTISTAIFFFGPALRLLGMGGAAAGAASAGGAAAASGAGGVVGAASRVALGALGPGAAVVGGIVMAHQAMDPLTEEQKRRHAPWLAAPQDGYGVDGSRSTATPAPPQRPIEVTLNLKVEGKVDNATLMTLVAGGIAKIISGPNGGTTSFDPKAGLHGGVGALP